MAQEPIYITTGVGRYVQGDLFVGSDKDHQGRPRLDQKGQPKVVYYYGLAFAKADPAFAEIWAAMSQVAQRDFPGGEFNRPDFAWKLIDGDQPKPDGKPRPDYMRGHYVLRCSSGFAPTVYDDSAPTPRQIIDPTQCKRGDFGRTHLSLVGNNDRQKPGIYVNGLMFQRCGFGEPIVTGPSAAEVFATPAGALPPGASATPVAAGPMPAMPGGYPGHHDAHPATPHVPGMPPAAVPPTAPSPVAPGGYAAPAAAPAGPTAFPTNPAVAPYYPILNPGAPVR